MSSNNNEVMNMNTKAIALLLQEEQVESMVTLQDALRNFKSCLAAEQQQEQESTTTNCSRCQWTTQTVELPDTNHKPTDRTASTQTGFELFNCAFVFLWENNNNDGMMMDTEDENDERVIPAVILYNMGLCHHREALRRGDSNGLRLASQFYSHALALVEAIADDLRESDLVLLAALANNMAHIANSFFDRQSASIFHKMLEDIMDSVDMDDVDEEEAQVFFSMNLLMVTELKMHCIAPAA